MGVSAIAGESKEVSRRIENTIGCTSRRSNCFDNMQGCYYISGGVTRACPSYAIT
uniref:Uncharacterized protein n=1 Tax=Arundo donax TaxID=35708 RepID=A0A0A8YEP4_ARUDO